MKFRGHHYLPLIGQNRPLIGRIDLRFFPFICENSPFVVLKPSKGLTLIELIITITIVSILAMLAAPGLQSVVKNQRLTSQTNDLIADLNFARSEAVKRATWVSICKTTDPNASSPSCDTTASAPWTPGRLIFVDSGSGTSSNDGNGILNSNETLLRIQQGLDGNNKLHGDNAYTGTITGTANKITFLATGQTNLVPKTGGDAENQLVLCDNRGPSVARVIAVHTSGRARVIKNGKNLDGTNLSCP